MSKLNRMGQKHSDLYQTPPEAVDALLSVFDPEYYVGWKVWECAAGRGMLASSLEACSFNVIATDLHSYPPLSSVKVKSGVDFLRSTPDFDYDFIVTNPPFSLKTQFFRRAFEIGMPFAFLCNLDTLGSRERWEMYKKYGISLVLLDRRTQMWNFDGTCDNNIWFQCAWFVHGFGFSNQILYAEMQRGEI